MSGNWGYLIKRPSGWQGVNKQNEMFYNYAAMNDTECCFTCLFVIQSPFKLYVLSAVPQ